MTGCASITNDTTNPMRFETFSEAGVEIKGADCKLENDYGVQNVTTPITVNVRRSSKDLQITCVKAGQADGRGVAISRANAGMAGNILFGGGIGAIIDHNKGTAYTYPEWVRVVMGKMLTFDRKFDAEGKANLGVRTVAPVPANAEGKANVGVSTVAPVPANAEGKANVGVSTVAPVPANAEGKANVGVSTVAPVPAK